MGQANNPAPETPTRPLPFPFSKDSTVYHDLMRSMASDYPFFGESITGHAGRSSTSQSVFRLLDLSAEIVENIASCLDNESILSMRQTCRALQTHSLFEFGKRFLSHVVAILHPLSLGMLLKISQDPDLSIAVRRITISGERIDGDLAVEPPVDTDKAVEWQQSMDRSEDDGQMLSDIFRGLVNLEKIEIDNSSYSHPRGALRCGKEHLIPEGWTCMPRGERDGTRKNNVIRAWNTVVATIAHSPNRDRIRWHLELDSDAATTLRDEMFDPNSAPWAPDYGKRVAKICLYRGLPGRWCEDLLYSLAGLEIFQIRGNFKPFSFSHPTRGMFVWPRIYTLWLNAIKVEQDAMIGFLEAHRDTVLFLALWSVDVIKGSWLDVFECIAGLPQLEKMDISSLRQLEVLPQYSDQWGIDISHKNCNTQVECANKWYVRTALRAFLTRFRCYQCSHDTVLSHVDLSLAYAAVNDDVFWRKGGWVVRKRVEEARILERAG